MTAPQDIHAIIEYCKDKLDFTVLASDSQSYQHLPACVIDTVFSIGARYTSTSNTVMRFCKQLGLAALGANNFLFPPFSSSTKHRALTCLRERSIRTVSAPQHGMEY